MLGLLQAAQLHPTLARVAILMVLADCGQQGICVGDLYQALAERGMQAAMGTVYRNIQDMEACGLVLREWEHGRRKAMYRIKPKELDDPTCIRLVCRASGRIVVLGDAALHAHLLQVAIAAGIDLADQPLRIEIGRLKLAGTGDAREGPAQRKPRAPLAQAPQPGECLDGNMN